MSPKSAPLPAELIVINSITFDAEGVAPPPNIAISPAATKLVPSEK